MAGPTLASLDARVSALERHHAQLAQAAATATGRSTLSHLEPASVPQGTAFNARGEGFQATSVVLADRVEVPTTFLSATALSATLPSSVAVGTTVGICVRTDGVLTNTLALTVVAAPVAPAEPTLTSLDPSSAVLGSPSFTLHVRGTGFIAESVVLWNGSPEATIYVSPTELTTGVNMDTATVATTLPVAVRTGATDSNSLPFTFTDAGPA